MKKHIDLNCDLGEGMPNDAFIIPFISSANIACGFHAGNQITIKKTIELCLKNNVKVGAHPSFFDRKNFGRINQNLSDENLFELISEQLNIIEKIAFEMGCILHHIKPHGALYNMAATDKNTSRIICKSIAQFDENLILYGLSGSCLIQEGDDIALKTANEVFADRTYQNDGTLTPRTEPNALITDENLALQQVMQMINSNTVTTTENKIIPILADTICIHGDGKNAVAFAQNIHQLLKQNNIEIKSV